MFFVVFVVVLLVLLLLLLFLSLLLLLLFMGGRAAAAPEKKIVEPFVMVKFVVVVGVGVVVETDSLVATVLLLCLMFCGFCACSRCS